MSKTAGTPQKVTIAGITYDVPGDSDPTRASKWANEFAPTTGDSIQKKVRQSPNIEGLTLALTVAEYEQLENVASNVDDVPLALTYAGGEVLRADGGINLGEYSAANATADVMLMPTSSDGWTAFT